MSYQSAAQNYAYEYENCEPKYYTRIPNIIDHLTYDKVNPKTGKITKQRLSVYAKELYRIIRSIANEDSACWMTRDNLAELANMSTGQVTNCKRELQQKFHQLEGMPLILIAKCKRNISKNGKILGKSEYDKCTILNIWKFNNAYMANLKIIKKIEVRSPNDHTQEVRSPNDHTPLGVRSHDDVINNPINKNPLSKEQQPASVDAPIVSHIEKKNCFSCG